jgi:hypothetical protein
VIEHDGGCELDQDECDCCPLRDKANLQEERLQLAESMLREMLAERAIAKLLKQKA